MELLVYVRTEARTTRRKKVWKKRFKKLKFANVRAEEDWQMLLDLPSENEAQVRELGSEQIRIERILDD